jgi:hypothetical protein
MFGQRNRAQLLAKMPRGLRELRVARSTVVTAGG